MRAMLIGLLLAGMLLVPVSAGATSRSAAACENVEGTFLGQAIPSAVGFDVYVIAITGPLAGHPAGSQLVWVMIQNVTPGGTIHVTGIHRYATTNFGPLTTSDKGSIGPTGHVHNNVTIVEGGSGSFTAIGQIDLATGIVELRYVGRICSA